MIMEMKDLPTGQSGRVSDQRIDRIVELISPAQILEELPLTPEQEDAVLAHRGEVARVLDRDDDRLLVVVGPCSVHDVDAALEYAKRLSARAVRRPRSTSPEPSRCGSLMRPFQPVVVRGFSKYTRIATRRSASRRAA